MYDTIKTKGEATSSDGGGISKPLDNSDLRNFFCNQENRSRALDFVSNCLPSRVCLEIPLKVEDLPHFILSPAQLSSYLAVVGPSDGKKRKGCKDGSAIRNARDSICNSVYSLLSKRRYGGSETEDLVRLSEELILYRETVREVLVSTGATCGIEGSYDYRPRNDCRYVESVEYGNNKSPATFLDPRPVTVLRNDFPFFFWKDTLDCSVVVAPSTIQEQRKNPSPPWGEERFDDGKMSVLDILMCKLNEEEDKKKREESNPVSIVYPVVPVFVDPAVYKPITLNVGNVKSFVLLREEDSQLEMARSPLLEIALCDFDVVMINLKLFFIKFKSEEFRKELFDPNSDYVVFSDMMARLNVAKRNADHLRSLLRKEDRSGSSSEGGLLAKSMEEYKLSKPPTEKKTNVSCFGEWDPNHARFVVECISDHVIPLFVELTLFAKFFFKTFSVVPQTSEDERKTDNKIYTLLSMINNIGERLWNEKNYLTWNVVRVCFYGGENEPGEEGFVKKANRTAAFFSAFFHSILMFTGFFSELQTIHAKKSAPGEIPIPKYRDTIDVNNRYKLSYAYLETCTWDLENLAPPEEKKKTSDVAEERRSDREANDFFFKKISSLGKRLKLDLGRTYYQQMQVFLPRKENLNQKYVSYPVFSGVDLKTVPTLTANHYLSSERIVPRRDEYVERKDIFKSCSEKITSLQKELERAKNVLSQRNPISEESSEIKRLEDYMKSLDKLSAESKSHFVIQ